MNEKIELCHWANGNPHTIEVSVNAADTHLIWHEENGWNPTPGHEQDTIGACTPPVTTPPSTLPDTPLPTTTTTTTSVTTTLPVSPTTSTTKPEVTMSSTTTTAITGTHCTTPDGYPFITSYATCPVPKELSVTGVVPTARVNELAETGFGAGPLASIGLTAVVLGVALRRIFGR